MHGEDHVSWLAVPSQIRERCHEPNMPGIVEPKMHWSLLETRPSCAMGKLRSGSQLVRSLQVLQCSGLNVTHAGPPV